MSNSLSEHRTYKLDQVTTTKLEWAVLFLKEIGISAPAQRVILSRALDFYVEFLEELAITHSFSPNHKDIRNELYELAQVNTERPSPWRTLALPKLDLASFGSFPKYSTLARQYYQPIPALPKVKKPKKASMSFAELRTKHRQAPPLPDHEFTQDQPMELTGDPESGKLLFDKSFI